MTTNDATTTQPAAALVDAGLLAATWDEESAATVARVLRGTPIGVLAEDTLLATRIANALLHDDSAGDDSTRDDADLALRTPIHRLLAHGMTLLKNEGPVLPLRAGIHPARIAPDPEVEFASSLAFLLQHRIAVIDAAALVARSDPAEIEAAIRAASESVHAIVVIGPREPIADDADPALEEQHQLASRVAGAASRTIAIVTTTRSICLPWADQVDVILIAGTPRPETASAVAEVLTGAAEPQGRTTVTYRRCHIPSAAGDGQPCHADSTADYAWFYDAVSTPPLFWFGSGLGFGEWRYEDARFFDAEEHERVSIEVDLSNIGSRDAVETVQVYFSPAELTAPVRLVGFGRVSVRSGASAALRVDCEPELLRSSDPNQTGGARRLRGELLIARGLGDVRLRVPLH